ncbi:caffeine resistance [Purpureocillium lavendulum]|uniref:Caffeine resistance n=1 Tax=Purpureocillium lavendulum TaxID=1247861 RepID=A0AB34FWB0_9HYPO|nr:caffeine resistance [Purpureocillium lavendulum]
MAPQLAIWALISLAAHATSAQPNEPQFDPILAPALTQGEVWEVMIAQDPRAEGLLEYCQAINIVDREACRQKLFDTPEELCKPFGSPDFIDCESLFDPSSSNTPPPQSAVALEAAARCLERNKHSGNKALTKMFELNMFEMAQTASFKNTRPVPQGMVQDASGQWFEYKYSIEERLKAAEEVKKQWEALTNWAFDFGSLGTGAATAKYGSWPSAAATGAVLAGKYLTAELSYWTGYGHPEIVGQRPWKCPSEGTHCFNAEGDKAPKEKFNKPPQTPGSDGDSGDGGGGQGTDDNTGDDIADSDDDDNETTEDDDDETEDEDTETAENDGEDGEGDEDDEDDVDEEISTPADLDGTERGHLEQCAEEEERKIWQHIGSTTVDPDKPTEDEKQAEAEALLASGICDATYYGVEKCKAWEDALHSHELPPEFPTRDEKQAEAEQLLASGICDTAFYGFEFCQKWKNELDSTPVNNPEIVPPVLNPFPLCSENVLASGGCELLRLEFHAKYMTSQNATAAVDKLFTPSPPIKGRLPTVDQIIMGLRRDFSLTPKSEGQKRSPSLIMRGGMPLPRRRLYLYRKTGNGAGRLTGKFGAGLGSRNSNRVRKAPKQKDRSHDEL